MSDVLNKWAVDKYADYKRVSKIVAVGKISKETIEKLNPNPRIYVCLRGKFLDEWTWLDNLEVFDTEDEAVKHADNYNGNPYNFDLRS